MGATIPEPQSQMPTALGARHANIEQLIEHLRGHLFGAGSPRAPMMNPTNAGHMIIIAHHPSSQEPYGESAQRGRGTPAANPGTGLPLDAGMKKGGNYGR